MKIARFVLICAFAVLFSSLPPASAQTGSYAAGMGLRDEGPQGLGSVEQYNRDNWDSDDAEFQIPLIGISVRNGSGKLASGQPLRGLGVIAVTGESPADAAGVHGERAAVRAALVGAFFAGSIIFPPAMFGAVLLEESGLGQPRDLIIAVDGARTQDVVEFESAIRRANVGEIVYLTIVRDGRRQQFRVKLAEAHQPRG